MTANAAPSHCRPAAEGSRVEQRQGFDHHDPPRGNPHHPETRRSVTGAGGVVQSGASNSGQHVPHRVTVGDHRRQHPGKRRRGSGRPRPAARPGSRGTPRPCRARRPARAGGRPPGPGPPPAACSRSACRPRRARCRTRQHNRTSQSCSSVAPSGIGPNPNRAATWCGVSIRVPSYLLLIWNRPYPSDPTAPIHT